VRIFWNRDRDLYSHCPRFTYIRPLFLTSSPDCLSGWFPALLDTYCNTSHKFSSGGEGRLLQPATCTSDPHRVLRRLPLYHTRTRTVTLFIFYRLVLYATLPPPWENRRPNQQRCSHSSLWRHLKPSSPAPPSRCPSATVPMSQPSSQRYTR
jgi:hypothetical protein